MKKIIRESLLILALLVLGAGVAKADVGPVYSILSPEASKIGMYGEIPTNLYTGNPDISVPVYTLSAGKMQIPVSLCYHLASVKPNQYPGSTGLGWSLACGGCISRTVRGICDEKCMLVGGVVATPGFYGHCSEMSGITPSSFATKTNNNLLAENINDYYELSADEFSFNFCGYSGNFYLNENGEWTVVSDQDIKVVFNPSSGFGTLSELTGRIDGVQQWNNKDNNRRFFKEFTIITPDGSHYIFGGINAIEFSVPYYNRLSGDLIANSWYLREIHTPDNHTVYFAYSTDEKMVDIRYSPGEKTTYNLYASNITYLHSRETGRNAFTGFLLFPVKLISVSSPSATVRFDYVVDWRYNYSYTTYGAGCLYWSDRGYSHPDVYAGLFDEASRQFREFFPSIGGGSDNEIRENISGALRAKTLHRIAISSGMSRYSVYLSYYDESRRKLKGLHWRDGIPDIDISYMIGGGVAYPVYNIPDRESDSWPEYGFKYNAGKMPNGYVLPQTDLWGYYNGRSFSLSDTDILESDGAVMNTSATKYETLEEIIYPTGGRVHFDYEGHRYSKAETPSRQIIDSGGAVGGLRVRTVTNLTYEGDTVSVKNYVYRDGRSSNAPSSGVARLEDPQSLRYTLATDDANVVLVLKSLSGFGSSSTNMNSPHVGYSTVFEETMDKNGNCLGYVKYQFSNYDTDIYGQSHQDELAYASCNISANADTSPCSSNSAERGKLLSRTWYTGDDREVSKEEYHYSRVRNGGITTATQRLIYVSTDPYNPIIARIGWLTHTYTYSYLPVRVDITENGVCTTTLTEYNNSFLKISETELSGNGGSRTRSYTYPCDYPGQYQWMEDNHIVSPLISESEMTDGHARITLYDYGNASDSQFGYAVPYLRKTEKRTSSEESFRTVYEVVSVDAYGNPTEIIEDGVHSLLFWGRLGQRLTKRIWDMTREEYDRLPTLNSQHFYQEEPERSITGKMMWTYDYGDHLLLSRESTPDGVSTSYDYDSLGRLVEKSYLTGQGTAIRKITTNTNEYHFTVTAER